MGVLRVCSNFCKFSTDSKSRNMRVLDLKDGTRVISRRPKVERSEHWSRATRSRFNLRSRGENSFVELAFTIGIAV